MSEQFAIDEVRDLPAYQFRSAGIVYAPSPAPTAILVLPDNSTQSLTLTQQGTGAATRYVIEDFSYSTAAQLEVRVTTTDTAADIAEFVEYVTVREAEEVDLTPVLDAIDAITAGQVTVTSPVDAMTGNLELIRGDSYHNAEGRALSWTSDAWTPLDLSAAKSVTFKARSRYSSTVFSKAAEVLSDTLVRLELTSAETGAFTVGRDAYRFDLEAVLADDDIVTLAQGKLSVVEDVRGD